MDFQSISYVDPFAPLPTGATEAGVLVTLTDPPANQIAYARLVANKEPIGYGAGTATSVSVLNTEPLVPGVGYLIEVQYDRPYRDPEVMNWMPHKGVVFAPVVVQRGRIDAGQVIPGGLILTWETAAISSAAGGYLQVVDLTGNQLTGAEYRGTEPSPSLTASFAPGRSYGVRISAAQPVYGAGAFTAPFSYGPPTQPQPIPTAAPVLSRLSCTAAGVAAQWSAPPVPPNAAPARYEILLLDGAKLISAAPAGESGGQLATGELAALTAPQLAARVSYGAFTGPVGDAAPLYPLAPQIVSVTVTGDSSATVTAELASPGPLPGGGVLLATLYRDGVPQATQTLAAATGTVSWPNVAVVPGAHYEIDVALRVEAAGAQSLGMPSPRLAVPLIAPTAMIAGYDGQLVAIDLDFPAGRPVDGYRVTLTGSTGGRLLTSAGAQLPIGFAADLDLAQTWTAEVVPLLGVLAARAVTGPVSAPALSAPALTTVGYDGAELTLQWTAARLPYLTGYQVAIDGTPVLVVGGDQTSCVLPLAPDRAAGAGVTVTGRSTLRDSAASAAVPVLTSSIEISSVTADAEVGIDTKVVAAWSAEPPPPAVRAVLMLGGSVARTLPDATATGVSFAAPAPAGQPFTLVARAVSADGVATGPASAPVPLILSAPAIVSGALGPGKLGLRWTPGESAAGVTGYRLTATPTTGDPASLQATGTGYDGPAPAAFSAPGTLSVTPVGGRTAGPAATARVLPPVAVTAAEYAAGELRVTADLSGAGPADTSWLEVLVNGAVLVRQPATGAPPYTVPVALPAGVTAGVRAGIDGPAALAAPATPLTVPTRVPVVREAGYDGSRLHVRWTPTGEPGVTGYLVSVTGTGDSYVAGAGSDATAVTVALDYPFPAGVTASVRAAAGAPGSSSSGLGQPSAGLAPSLAGSCYPVAVTQAGYPAYLYRRGVYADQAAVAGQPIVLYLAKPFTGAGDPTVPASGSPVFQLAPAPGGTLPYRLTISADAWSMTASPVRTALRDAYNSFLTAVEAAGVTPWAIGLLRQLIAQAMPQTFEEVLFYRYGYWHSDSLRVVDLMPGTRLQLAGALYQALAGTPSERNGFTATGTEILDVVDAVPQAGASTLPPGAGRILSVDALLSLVYPGSGAGRTGRPVAAGPLDFFADNNRQCYYRLFYPASFPASSSTGNPALTSNIALIGTTSWATLDAVTTQYEATNTFPTSQSYFATYFRGRAGLTPLVNVGVQGESRWVALGTSVRQALSSIGLAPYWGGGGGDLVSLLRASANLFANPEPDAGLTFDPVDLTGAGLNGLTPLYWPLDMPLVGGDQLSVGQAPA